MLLRGLPSTANVWREDNGGWSSTEYLLATVAEQANFTARAVLASIPQRKGRARKLPDPLVIPRPGPKPKKNTWADLGRRMTGRR